MRPSSTANTRPKKRLLVSSASHTIISPLRKSETGGAVGTEASDSGETAGTGVPDVWGGNCKLGWEDNAEELSAGAGGDSGSGAEGEEGGGGTDLRRQRTWAKMLRPVEE
uniref:Uncharacterized protein n=1 Tax=Chromera velia CCMP2878 TaxID=1169474 RepID=A0A0G4IDT1_9ALVE|eukprot:Cvel_13397.t1-p1 / transcript=Cvel_13397.t1 / gene=Cvel_13397 / organism=Chromera_velia_CCMP2878 / gene_product=hypothetical protein / transcript_product=hypothetical protein / location=Cvel_scaffold913:4583-4909(+) / protein_length=109 / sequence_SO=supercontig / SO=protein_coding / is_pseudo=false